MWIVTFTARVFTNGSPRPIGTGVLYVRKDRIEKHWAMMAAPESMDKNIRKFEEIGTHPAATHNAILQALEFYEQIGAERKFGPPQIFDPTLVKEA